MSTTTLTGILCGKCHNRHQSVREVWFCHFPSSAMVAQSALPRRGTVNLPSWRTEPVTGAQKDRLRRMGIDPNLARNKGEASDWIGGKTDPPRKASSVIEDAPNRRQTKIPMDMLLALPDGYYAAQLDSTRPYTFFRINRPKSGKLKGAFKVQTQHGPELMLALVIYDESRLYWHNMSIEDELLLVAIDPNAAAICYSEELKRCMRCNTELTDERSRWFGIGPECTKHWPHIEPMVEDRKGRYVPGWEQK